MNGVKYVSGGIDSCHIPTNLFLMEVYGVKLSRTSREVSWSAEIYMNSSGRHMTKESIDGRRECFIVKKKELCR